MRLTVLSAGILVVQVSVALAEPWAARTGTHGMTASGSTDVAAGTLASKWNILSVGLFCGSPKLGAGKVNFFMYGIGIERSSAGSPLDATIVVDGAPTDLTFSFFDDLAVTAVTADFVKRFMSARSVSVLVKDYNSPNPEAIVMEGAAAAIQTALKRCLR
jgi:hypothetical protein